MQATAARDVPVVEAECIDHIYADGWVEIVRPGVTALRFYRNAGPNDDMERVVFMEIHIPTFAFEALIMASAKACVRDCQMRVRGMMV